MLACLAVIPFLLHGNYLIFNSILDIYIDPFYFFNRFIYLWNSQEWAGTITSWGISYLFPVSFFTSIFSFFKLPGAVIERIWFTFILFLSGVSMYYLISVITAEKYYIARMVSAIAYTYNLYIFVGLQGASVLLLPYATLPLMLGIYIRGASDRNYIKYAILFGFATSVMSFISPPLVVSSAIVLASYFLYHIFFINNGKNISQIMKLTLFVLLFSILLNSWVILPIIQYILTAYATDIPSIFSEKLSWINNNSSFSETFRLLGIWYFYGTGAPDVLNFSYSPLFKHNAVFILTSFLIPILALVALIKKPTNRYINFFGILIIIAIPMAVGIYPTQNPSFTGKIFLWAYQNIPFFNIFKDNYRPFVAIIALSYAVLLGSLTNDFYLYLKNKIIPSNKHPLIKKILPMVPVILIIGIILINSFPIITGNIFYEPMKIKYIPNYWSESANWINEQQDDFRVLFLPEQKFALYTWGSTVGEISLSIYKKSQIFTVASVANTPNVKLINLIYKSINQDSTANIAKAAGIMNIRYILQRNDYDWEFSVNKNSPEYIRSVLNYQEGIYLEKTFGELDFYRIPDEYFLPHIYSSTTPILINGSANEMFQLVTSDNFTIGNKALFLSNYLNQERNQFIKEYSRTISSFNDNTQEITFQRINPTKYQIKIENATQPFFLVFSESYHPEWKAYVEDKELKFDEITTSYDKLKVSEVRPEMRFSPKDIFYPFAKPVLNENHFLVNGYANAWYIDTKQLGKGENFTVTLYFEPQSYFYIGLIMSVLTFMGGMSYLFWNRQKKERTKL